MGSPSSDQYNRTPTFNNPSTTRHSNDGVPDHEEIERGATVGASQQEIISGLAEIIEEVTGIEPSEVTPEKSFVDDLDIDSLSMVEIAVQTEDKYGVKIPDEDLAGLRTVGDVVAYIQKLEEENPEAAEALREKFAK
jgi:acyl carrier protein